MVKQYSNLKVDRAGAGTQLGNPGGPNPGSYVILTDPNKDFQEQMFQLDPEGVGIGNQQLAAALTAITTGLTVTAIVDEPPYDEREEMDVPNCYDLSVDAG